MTYDWQNMQPIKSVLLFCSALSIQYTHFHCRKLLNSFAYLAKDILNLMLIIIQRFVRTRYMGVLMYAAYCAAILQYEMLF